MNPFTSVRAAERASWPEVPPEKLSPQALLLYSSTFSFMDHRNSLPGAGFYLVTDGEVTYHNRGVGSITARAGDLVCLRPGFVHTYSKTGYRVHAVVYRASASEPRGIPSLPSIGVLPPIIPIRSRQRLEEARLIYERMMESMLARRSTWQLEIFHSLSGLLRLAFSLAVGNVADKPTAWSRWERLLSLVETSGDLTNTQMARTMNMGVRGFGRGFKQRFGITPRQYLLRRRLWRAREALHAGTSVKAAAFEFGFASPSHLSRLFKQNFGVAPSQASASSTLETRLETSFPAGPLYFFAPGVGSADFRP